MKSSVTKSFRKQLEQLPPQVQEQVAKAYALWQNDPYYKCYWCQLSLNRTFHYFSD